MIALVSCSSIWIQPSMSSIRWTAYYLLTRYISMYVQRYSHYDHITAKLKLSRPSTTTSLISSRKTGVCRSRRRTRRHYSMNWSNYWLVKVLGYVTHHSQYPLYQQTVHVDRDTLIMLAQESLEKPAGIQRLEEAASELYKALQAGRDRGADSHDEK